MESAARRDQNVVGTGGCGSFGLLLAGDQTDHPTAGGLDHLGDQLAHSACGGQHPAPRPYPEYGVCAGMQTGIDLLEPTF